MTLTGHRQELDLQLRRIERLNHGQDDVGCPTVPEVAYPVVQQLRRRIRPPPDEEPSGSR